MSVFKNKKEGLYQHESGSYYWRPWVNNVRTWRKLESATKKDAQRELALERAKQARFAAGLAESPFAPDHALTVAGLVDFYVKEGCPKRKGQVRQGKQLEEEVRRGSNLKRLMGNLTATQVTIEDCDRYADERRREIQRNSHGADVGSRAVDLELQSLSCAYRWARRKSQSTGVRVNPLAERPRYQMANEVTHCREAQPADAEELHRLARFFFDAPDSEVLGWQLLSQALTGLRRHEVLQLRMDAASPDDPGFVDSKCLYFPRSDTHKGVAQFARLHPALKKCIQAHRVWHRMRFPESPWWFPSPVLPGARVDLGALPHGLLRASKLLKLPRRTTHGLRSYFVNVLRSQKVPDAQIALMIGQKTGGALIVQVYGEWRNQTLAWLPKTGVPAWAIWQAPEVRKVLPVPAAA